jgi:hypothetical protein
MFIVKHEANDRSQSLLVAGSVSYTGRNDPQLEVRAFGVPGRNESQDGPVVFTDGVVYVMNEAGKTVSILTLG